LIAGSGAGAVLALGLAAPGPDEKPRFQAAQLLDLYVESGAEIFPVPDALQRLRRVCGLARPHRPAQRRLRENFGETPIGDAIVDLLIPTFDVSATVPLILRSDEFGSGSGPAMCDLAWASSAMPTHYPPVAVSVGSRTWWLTHGGLVANNPAPLAYAVALSRAEPDEIAFVSLGAGADHPHARTRHARNEKGRWPLSASRSFELQLECAAEAEHQMLDGLLAATGRRENFWRIQPSLAEEADNGANSDPVALSYDADQVVRATRPTIEAVAEAVASGDQADPS
jgi:predicted acylesterase/phospholipase RssA